MPRPGWEKLSRSELASSGYSPSSERFRSPSGEVVSRRQYDNARYSDAGWRNRADFERRHNDPTYSFLVRRIAENEGVPRRAIDTPNSATAKLLLKARATGYGKRRAGRGIRGPMARALVRAGLRDPNATYVVGASPPRASGRRR